MNLSRRRRGLSGSTCAPPRTSRCPTVIAEDGSWSTRSSGPTRTRYETACLVTARPHQMPGLGWTTRTSPVNVTASFSSDTGLCSGTDRCGGCSGSHCTRPKIRPKPAAEIIETSMCGAIPDRARIATIAGTIPLSFRLLLVAQRPTEADLQSRTGKMARAVTQSNMREAVTPCPSDATGRRSLLSPSCHRIGSLHVQPSSLVTCSHPGSRSC